MNTDIVTNKFTWRNIAATAATMAVVLLLYKLFVRQYMTSDGVMHTTLKTPSIKAEDK